MSYLLSKQSTVVILSKHFGEAEYEYEKNYHLCRSNLILPNPSQKGLFHRVHPLAIGVPLAKMVPPQRHHFSLGHHFSPCNGSQLNCHKRRSPGKFSYSTKKMFMSANIYGNPAIVRPAQVRSYLLQPGGV